MWRKFVVNDTCHVCKRWYDVAV
eukprot:COSAG01_NODE_75625_length_194_cov_48.778947_1_plen_22_part_01